MVAVKRKQVAKMGAPVAKRQKLDPSGASKQQLPSKEEASAEVKAWADDTGIKYQAENPKSKGTDSFKRYAAYSKARTVGEALKKGAKRADLTWDYSRGLVKPLAGRQAVAKKEDKPLGLKSQAFRAVARPAAAASLTDGIELTKGGPVFPVVGFGTYKLKKGEASKTVLEALKAGYRCIDTAQVYENEGDVGEAIKKSGLSRDQVFVETKVWRSSHGYDRTLKAAQSSLKKLGGSIDLYLIHWPGCKTGWPLKRGTSCPPNWKPHMRDGGPAGTWRAMEKLHDEGKVKALGVCNYSVRHLQLLLKSCRVKPTVNQVELHPRLIQTKLLDFCRSKGITVQAYASLGSGDAKQTESFMAFPPIQAAAKAHKKTPAQVLLRWAIDKGLHVVPKSVKPERMQENSGVFSFKLSVAEVKAIDGMNTNTRYAWKGLDPDTIA